MTRILENLDDVGKRHRHINRIDIGARHHDILDPDVAQLQHVAEHDALFVGQFVGFAMAVVEYIGQALPQIIAGADAEEPARPLPQRPAARRRVGDGQLCR